MKFAALPPDLPRTLLVSVIVMHTMHAAFQLFSIALVIVLWQTHPHPMLALLGGWGIWWGAQSTRIIRQAVQRLGKS